MWSPDVAVLYRCSIFSRTVSHMNQHCDDNGYLRVINAKDKTIEGCIQGGILALFGNPQFKHLVGVKKREGGEGGREGGRGQGGRDG